MLPLHYFVFKLLILSVVSSPRKFCTTNDQTNNSFHTVIGLPAANFQQGIGVC